MSSSFRTKASVSQPRYAALRALPAESKRRGKLKAKAMHKKKTMSLSKLAKKGKKKGLKKLALEKAMTKHELPPLPPPAAPPPVESQNEQNEPAPAETEVPPEGTWRVVDEDRRV